MVMPIVAAVLLLYVYKRFTVSMIGAAGGVVKTVIARVEDCTTVPAESVSVAYT